MHPPNLVFSLILAMLKYGLLFFLICFAVSVASAQTVIKGRVYEEKTHTVLINIEVRDIDHQKITTTNNDGAFTIPATVGDRLVFGGFSYLADTVLVANKFEFEVYLKPKQNMLNTVNITLNSVAAPTTFKQYDPMYHGQTFTEKPGGGVIMRISDWNKDAKKKERDAKMEADGEIRDKINAAFNTTTIVKYVPLKGDDLNGFIELYKPTVELYNSPDFKLVTYINDCYKEFVKLPADKRHLVKLGDQ